MTHREDEGFGQSESIAKFTPGSGSFLGFGGSSSDPTKTGDGDPDQDPTFGGLTRRQLLELLTAGGVSAGVLGSLFEDPAGFIREKVVTWILEGLLGLWRGVIAEIVDAGQITINQFLFAASSTARGIELLFAPGVVFLGTVNDALFGAFTGLGLVAPAATLATLFVWTIFLIAVAEFLVRTAVFSVLENVPVIGIVFSILGRFVFWLGSLPERFFGED